MASYSDTAFSQDAFDVGAWDFGSGTVFGRSGLGGDDVPRRNPNRGWNRKEWERLKKAPDDALEATLRRVYAELTEEAPASVVAQADAIVLAKPKADAPPEINWSRLNFERASQLMALYQEEMALRQDAEDLEDLERFL